MKLIRKYAKRALARYRQNSYVPLNYIELDRSRLLHNFMLVQSQHPDLEIMPVLKGNAYGHGLKQVAEMLNAQTCRYLVVDGYFEASVIRDVTTHHILVLGYIRPENIHLLDTKQCAFVLQDVNSLVAFGQTGKPIRVHLEINTGMNRLGLLPAELNEYLTTLKRFPNLQLEGVMTHLADADNPTSNSFTELQFQRFEDQVQRIKGAGFAPSLIHITQTAGSAKVQSRIANALRLGIGLYGINPLATDDSKYTVYRDLQPILELKSTIIKVLNVEKGESIGYNLTFTAPQNMRIGVLPLGYYEGIPRSLSNKGCAIMRDKVFPIVGRICMNHTMIDVSDSTADVGDTVTLISHNPQTPNSIASLHAMHGLFPYNVLTGLSSTIRRAIL